MAAGRPRVASYAKVSCGPPRDGRQVLRSILLPSIPSAPTLAAPGRPLAAVRAAPRPPLASRHGLPSDTPTVSAGAAARPLAPVARQVLAAGAAARRAARTKVALAAAAAAAPVPLAPPLHGADKAQVGLSGPVREGGPRPLGRATLPSLGGGSGAAASTTAYAPVAETCAADGRKAYRSIAAGGPHLLLRPSEASRTACVRLLAFPPLSARALKAAVGGPARGPTGPSRFQAGA